MAIRINTLAKGHSGVRQDVVDLLVEMLDRDIIPYVPSRGSLGASGDLAPSAHLVLAMMGEGELLTADGQREPAAPVLAAAGLHPLGLEPKEGLSLINGTHFMAAIGCLAVVDGESLLDSADLIGAMSIEGLKASVGPFQERIQKLRPIPGQEHTAYNVRLATRGSGIMLSHLNCDKVQDAYSIRCIPQVHGACRDALRWLREVITVEVDSVTDNPIVFPDVGEMVSAGNFHGEPLALALDLAAISLAEIGSMSERRTFRMLSPFLQRAAAVPDRDQRPDQRLHAGAVHGRLAGRREQGALSSRQRRFDPHLGRSGRPREHGHDGGAEARQRDAQLADHPRHRGAVRGAGHRPACAAQPGVGTARAHEIVRGLAPKLENDRYLSPEIERAADCVARGDFAAVVRELRAAGEPEPPEPETRVATAASAASGRQQQRQVARDELRVVVEAAASHLGGRLAVSATPPARRPGGPPSRPRRSAPARPRRARPSC